MRNVHLSNFEFKNQMFETLPTFWSAIYVELKPESLENFESMLPNDSEFFTSIKSSPVKYKAFIDTINNINNKEVEQ